MSLPRRPSLDDYDRGDAFKGWAEHIAARAHAPYDEIAHDAAEWPVNRSINERAADARAAAATAAERYAAYRERSRIEDVASAQRRKLALDEREKRDRERAKLEAERQLVRAEWAQSREALARTERERRARWQAEQAEWAAYEWERAIESARHVPEWGTGAVIRIMGMVRVRWNEHPAEGHIQLLNGDVLRVSPRLASALERGGHAEILAMALE